jgi:cobalt-zinc-cadmium efflux system protein
VRDRVGEQFTHHRRGESKRALTIVLGIITAFFVVEALGGYFTHSLALLADAGHLLTDVGALALALFAFRIAERPATPRRTYGNLRVEIVAALVNGVTLLVVAVYIGYEAFRRFVAPPEVLSLPMLLVAITGFAGQSISAFVLRRSSQENLNVHAAFIHVATDAVQSLGVVAAGAFMLAFRWYLADPIISMVIAVLITWTGLRITWASLHVLMEGAPSGIDASVLRRAMEGVSGVKEVHDLHIWTITSGYNALSAHVLLERELSMEDAQSVLSALHAIASGDYGIQHVTIQIEARPPEWPDGRHPRP